MSDAVLQAFLASGSFQGLPTKEDLRIYSDIRPDYLNYGEAIDQMRNGLVDAAFGGQPSGLEFVMTVTAIREGKTLLENAAVPGGRHTPPAQ